MAYTQWSLSQFYRINDVIVGSDNNLYRALSNHIGHDPTTSPTYWKAITTSTPVPAATLEANDIPLTFLDSRYTQGGGGGGGLPTPSLTTGWQPGFGCTSGQAFTMSSGTTSFTYPFDRAYTLSDSVPHTTLLDDEWIHWDPGSPTTFTVKKSGWYWYNFQVTIGPLGLSSPMEWLVQPIFGLVNGQVTRLITTQRQLWVTDSGMGYIVGPQTCEMALGLTGGSTNTTNFNIPGITDGSVQMFLTPLF
jgi:hypothetical protein